MYFTRIKSSVFSGLSRNRCSDYLSVLKSGFSSVLIFCFVAGIKGGSTDQVHQENLSFGRRKREKEKDIIVVSHAYFV